MLRGMPGHAAGTISIVQAAGQGDLQAVKDIIKTSPDKVLSQNHTSEIVVSFNFIA
jgi:hypothetical protein